MTTVPFDKEEDRIFSMVLRNQKGYVRDIYQLAEKSLSDALISYETAETVTFAGLDKDIMDVIYDRRGRIRLQRDAPLYQSMISDEGEFREEMFEGVSHLVHHILQINEPVIQTLYNSYNIRDLSIPVITPGIVPVIVTGLKV